MIYKWSLIQSGKVIGRFGTIEDCIYEVRRLMPDSRVTQEKLSSLLHEVTVVSADFVTYYTLIGESYN